MPFLDKTSKKDNLNIHTDLIIEKLNGFRSQPFVSRLEYKRCSRTSYSRREVKKARKLSIIVFFFMICWIPLYLSNTLEAFLISHQPAWLVDTFIILSHLNSALNPILYAYHMRDFREAMKNFLCKCVVRRESLRDLRRKEMRIVGGKATASSLSNFT